MLRRRRGGAARAISRRRLCAENAQRRLCGLPLALARHVPRPSLCPVCEGPVYGVVLDAQLDAEKRLIRVTPVALPPQRPGLRPATCDFVMPSRARAPAMPAAGSQSPAAENAGYEADALSPRPPTTSSKPGASHRRICRRS